MPKPYHGKKNKIKFHANSSQILRDAFVIGHNTKKPPMRHALRALFDNFFVTIKKKPRSRSSEAVVKIIS